MTSDLEVLQVAALLIKEHDAGAWTMAAARYDELKAAGDTEGAAVWHRIAGAIATLDDTQTHEPLN